MNDWQQTPVTSRRSWVVPVLLVGIGIGIGVMVASDLGWLPSGAAGPEPRPTVEVHPVATAPQSPITSGSGRNFVEIAKLVKPTVVNISATRSGRSGEGLRGSPFDDPFFRRFFGEELPKERKERGQGSGVIVDASGVIITNNHVVNKADEIKVVLSDKREFKAKLIGTDTKTDVAVVKIEATGLPVIPWADSDQLEVGEFVLAVGNPFGLTQTVTMGIVSAVGRASMGIAEYEDFIQTDAAINPGNSGGALVNVRGELVGINTAIFTRSGGYMGIGFAVPSQMVKAVITRGDVIIEIDRKAVENAVQLRNLVAGLAVGAKVNIKVIRDKKEKAFDVAIGEQPKDLTRGGAPSQEDAGSGALAGLSVHDVTPEFAQRFGLPDEEGVVVTRVEPGSLADDAGVQRGDLILEINRQVVRNTRDFNRIAGDIAKDESILLLVNRQGQTLFITITQ